MRRIAFSVPIFFVALACFTLKPVAVSAQGQPRERVRTEAELAAEKAAEEAMAAYADAANFQTGGAIPLAIEAWQAFLKDYPKHAMAAQASHYLGVCYMQQDQPDYVAAAEAFGQALRNRKYDLREESLANQGWCLYTSAGQPPGRDVKRLRSAIEVFETLRKEFPESDFLDRADFYIGEAHYGLGEPAKAVQSYNAMLAGKGAAKSPLRCDALYARGIAYEELEELEKAKASFGQLLQSCADSDLATDVHLRVGDLAILRKDYDGALESFRQAFQSAGDDEDKAYALFRQAFANVKLERTDQAAKDYERLLAEFPDSRFAAAATLASAQTAYRGGNIDVAAERFSEVLSQNDLASATEAAHWLTRIRLSQGDIDAAIQTATSQIDKGVQGEFATSLRLDLAEAFAANPKTIDQAIEKFKQVFDESADDPLAPRALYNAAFFNLQTGRPDEAVRLSRQFEKRYPDDTLSGDVGFIAAEALLAAGDIDNAAARYEKLLDSKAHAENPQRPLWVIRGGATIQRSGRPDDAIRLLKSQMASLPESAQKAEAQLLIGQAHFSAGRPTEAAEAFRASQQINKDWARAGEAALLEGTALRRDGKPTEAAKVWTSLIARDGKDRMADQARFKLGQMAAADADHATAISRFEEILTSRVDPALIPFATFSKSRSELALKRYDEAIATLDPWLQQTELHPLKAEALMAKGIALRNLDGFDNAAKVLDTALTLSPQGGVLAGLLYESALIDEELEKYDSAITKLRRISRDVPTYPEMDKVVYELGWALRAAGKEDEAEKQFREFLKQYGDSQDVAEAAYFVAQRDYQRKQWKAAAKNYELAADRASDPAMSEKSLYRLGWARYKAQQLDESEQAFRQQAKKHPEGRYLMDALMMIGESKFKSQQYQEAIQSYNEARDRIRRQNESAKSLTDSAERQVRELILLHGGQSAAQLKQWDKALQWYGELRERFPASAYLAQVFYETAYAHQQSGDSQEALKFYGQVAQKYRNSVAARARFMMGEIHFDEQRYDQAILEFQRVMFGFGADKAPATIKNWQAKSGYEAGRCSEQLMQQAKTSAAQSKAKEFAIKSYKYVVDRHAGSDLAKRSAERLRGLQ